MIESLKNLTKADLRSIIFILLLIIVGYLGIKIPFIGKVLEWGWYIIWGLFIVFLFVFHFIEGKYPPYPNKRKEEE